MLPNKEACLAVKSVYIQERGRKCQFCTGVNPKFKVNGFPRVEIMTKYDDISYI